MTTSTRVIVGGVELNPNHLAFIAIRKIFGIGNSNSVKISNNVGVFHKRVKELSEEEISSLRKHVSTFTTGHDLKKELMEDVNRLKNIKSRRGKRISMGLPCRGQRTSSNAKTAKKNKQ